MGIKDTLNNKFMIGVSVFVAGLMVAIILGIIFAVLSAGVGFIGGFAPIIGALLTLVLGISFLLIWLILMGFVLPIVFKVLGVKI